MFIPCQPFPLIPFLDNPKDKVTFELQLTSSGVPTITSADGSFKRKQSGNVYTFTSSDEITHFRLFVNKALVSNAKLNLAEHLTNLDASFQNCINLHTVEFAAGVTANVTNLLNTFNTCSVLVNVIGLETPSVTHVQYTFMYCSFLETAPITDYSSVVAIEAVYEHCSALLYAGDIIAPNSDLMSRIYRYCTSLRQTGRIISNIHANWNNLTEGCTSLEVIKEVNMKCHRSFDAFADCPALECIGGNIYPNAVNTTNMFNNTDALLHPSAAEKATILTGTNWTNAVGCTPIVFVNMLDLDNFNMLDLDGNQMVAEI